MKVHKRKFPISSLSQKKKFPFMCVCLMCGQMSSLVDRNMCVWLIPDYFYCQGRKIIYIHLIYTFHFFFMTLLYTVNINQNQKIYKSIIKRYIEKYVGVKYSSIKKTLKSSTLLWKLLKKKLNCMKNRLFACIVSTLTVHIMRWFKWCQKGTEKKKKTSYVNIHSTYSHLYVSDRSQLL